MKLFKKHYIFFLAVLGFIFINIIFFWVKPEKFVETLGVENTYFIVFLIAAIGGISSLAGPIFFSTVLAFAAGGANPWLLGLWGGSGLFISDSVFFLMARLGKKLVSSYWQDKIAKFENRLRNFPRWMAFLVLYILLGFTPIPNDFLMIALAIGGYRYLNFFPYLLAGNITITFITAQIGDKL